MTSRPCGRAFLFLLTTCFAAAFPASADQYLAPALTGDAAVSLPRGRWMITFAGFGMDVSSRFDGGGGREPISNLFAREVGWNEVIADDPGRSAQVEGLLSAHGIAAGESAGTYRGEFRGDVVGKVPVVGYGITDRLGVFAALPVLAIRVRSRVVYEASPSAVTLVRSLRGAGQEAVARDFESSLDDGFRTQLRKAGYDYSESRDYSAVGDLRIEVPYLLRPARPGRSAAAIYGTLILPTGRTADPAEFYGISTGQKRFQSGVRGVLAQSARRWTFTESAGTVYAFSGSRAVRIPRDALDRLSPDVDPNARVSGGFGYSLAADTRFGISGAWALRGGLQHQRRFRDHYSGTLFPAERYAYVGEATSERLESAFLRLEGDSIASFLAGNFPIPGQVALGVAEPLSGRNAIADRIVFFQANLFF